MAIWDYGVGCTYATPQLAFDACQLANGGAVPAAFTENEYIRGYGVATYGGPGAGEPPLRLIASAGAGMGFGCLPTATFRLYIDVDAGATVLFNDDQNAAAIIGSNIAGTRVNSYVVVDTGLILQSMGAAANGFGIIINQDRTGATLAYDWIARCKIQADVFPIVCGNTVNLKCDGADLQSFSSAIFYADGPGGTYGAFFGLLRLANNKLRAALQCAFLLTGDVVLLVEHNTIACGDIPFYMEGAPAATYGAVLHSNNNVMKVDGNAEFYFLFDYLTICIGGLDGNCYYQLTTGNFSDINGTAYADLTAWQAATLEDQNSFVADPLLNTDLSLSLASPCRRRAKQIPPSDINGRSRDASFADCGADQATHLYTAAELLVIGPLT